MLSNGLATVTPFSGHADETTETLRCAKKAQAIVCQPKVHEETTTAATVESA